MSISEILDDIPEKNYCMAEYLEERAVMKIETETDYIYMHMYMALIPFVAAD